MRIMRRSDKEIKKGDYGVRNRPVNPAAQRPCCDLSFDCKYKNKIEF